MGLSKPFTGVKGVTAQPVTEPRINNFVTRILSAMVMIPLVLAAVYLGFPYFHILIAAAVVAMAWEWRSIVGKEDFGSQGMVMTSGLLFAVLAASMDFYLYAVGLIGITALIMAGISRQSMWMAAGALYIGIPSLALIWIRSDGDNGLLAVIWLLILVWAADSGAYAAGRLIGGPKLAPSISPNKTWAGFVGCGVSAALAGALVAHFAGIDGIMTAFFISGVIGLISQGGDLLESGFKRHFGVKDSSNLIPGHGGVLDRVDALLAAVFAAGAVSLASGGVLIF